MEDISKVIEGEEKTKQNFKLRSRITEKKKIYQKARFKLYENRMRELGRQIGGNYLV